MLIYAFRDGHGIWHADPHADIYDTQPGRGTLSLPPTQPGNSPGPFDGQRLEILYAACALEASQTSYRLDDGGVFLATWHVHELLSEPYRPASANPSALSSAPHKPSSVKLELSSTNRRYSLSVDFLAEGRLEITAIVCTADGVIQGELTGELDACDLSELGRLISSAPIAPQPHNAAPATSAAPAAPTPTVKTTRHGDAWTAEAHEYLRQQYRAGTSPSALAQELGRSEKSIRWKLYSLDLAPYPADIVPAPRTSPHSEPPKAYTVEDKRHDHPNAYKPWTPKDEQRLNERCAEGASLADLSHEFGRNQGAIASRLSKINAQGPAADEAWEATGTWQTVT